MHPFINIATKAARNASKIILRYIDRLDRVVITEKNRNDFVSEVDQLAEQEIIKIIHDAHPNHGVLAEETGEIAGNEFCWIIDPLDGTLNYLYGFPHFAISIAVKQRQQIIAGVIYDPIRNELFSAARGEGAHLNNRRIRVNQKERLEKALIGTGFPLRNLDFLPTYLKIFADLFPKTAGFRRAGSAALDFAYVAAGRLDGFWEHGLSPWDIAAGSILIQEAGGALKDFDGQDQFLEKGHVIAGNLKITQALLEIIKQYI